MGIFAIVHRRIQDLIIESPLQRLVMFGLERGVDLGWISKNTQVFNNKYNYLMDFPIALSLMEMQLGLNDMIW